METTPAKKKLSRGKKAGIIAGAVLVLVIAAVLVYGFVLTGSWPNSPPTPPSSR